MELDLAEFEAREVMEDVVVTADPLVRQNENRLNVAGDLGAMRSDRIKVRQVLVNLVSNGCKFTTPGTVRLTAARATDVGRRN